MADINPIIPQTEYNPLDDAPIVDFDTPAGRTQADRVVLALRYPSRADAVPIASVSKEIAGRLCWFIAYDADVLAGLLGMGWREGEQP